MPLGIHRHINIFGKFVTLLSLTNDHQNEASGDDETDNGDEEDSGSRHVALL